MTEEPDAGLIHAALSDPRPSPGSTRRSRGRVRAGAGDGGEGPGTAVADAVEAEGGTAPEQLILDLDGYEGPIDLLLSLAREQKVDLAKISILALADQFLGFIAARRKLRLEITADYLVMAAWLAFLKSRLLLPQPGDQEEADAAQITAALGHRLKLLEAMQTVGRELMARPRLGQDFFARGTPEGLAAVAVPVWRLELFDLLRAYGETRRRTANAMLVVEPSAYYSMEDALKRFARILGRLPDWRALVRFLPDDPRGDQMRRSALAATFAAALELARRGDIELRQDRAFGPIWLKSPWARIATGAPAK